MRTSAVAISVLMIWVIVLGCSQRGQQQKETLIVEVRHSTTEGVILTWRSSKPLRGVLFERQKDRFRTRSWTVLTPGAQIKNLAIGEAILSEEPRREFQVRVPAHPFEVYGDTAFLAPYSDGGVVIFLGHVSASPLTCLHGSCERPGSAVRLDSYERGVELVSSGSETIFVDGASFRGRRVVEETSQFVYFGKQRPVEIDGGSALIDPALPQWLRIEISKAWPRILALYTERIGIRLDRKPQLFVPFALSDVTGAERATGAVLGSRVLLSFEGGAWRRNSPERREEFLKLLAHEAFHLWNANLYNSPDQTGGAWLHEGAADALAMRALLDLGLISRARYSEMQIEAVNRCIVFRDMTISGEDRNPRAQLRMHYDCGASMNDLLQTAALRRGIEDFSLYDFWSKVFRSSDRVGRIYTHEEFLFASSSFAPELTDMFANLIGVDSLSEADNLFIDVFRKLGLNARSAESGFPSWYRKLMAQNLLEPLVQKDCGGRGYYVLTDDAIDLIGASPCQTIKTTQRILRVENFLLFDDGVEAYDYAQEGCRSRPDAGVAISHDAGYMTLPCAKLPKRPTYIQIEPEQS